MDSFLERMRKRRVRKQRRRNPDIGNKPTAVKTILNKKDLESHLDQARQTSKLLVMEFTAAESGPCKLMEPVLNDIASNHTTDADFWKIDADMFEEYAQKMQVEAVPTFVLSKNGVVVDRVVGIKKEDLESSIKKHAPEGHSKEINLQNEDQKKAEQQN